MIRALSTAVSGLRSLQVKMDAIGNNIANVNTIAFKSSQVRFDTLFSQILQGATAPSVRGGVNPTQLGMGIKVASTIANHSQGTLQGTNRETDLAIEGSGYFVVTDGRQYFYTREGSFSRDARGELVNLNGLKLIGWESGPVGSTQNLNSIHIPLGERMVANATTSIFFGGNLDVRTGVGGTYSYEQYVYDSLGRHYVLEYTFTREEGVNTWSYSVDMVLPEGNENIGTGELIYTEKGALDLDASSIANLTYAPEGADELDISMHFETSTQVAGLNNLLVMSQDGSSAGELVSFFIERTGTILGAYTNGILENLGQVALAYFTNPEGLIQEGGNLYSSSANSGDARIGMPGVEGRGLIQSLALEMSNADLSFEFTEMIATSRAFQANTRMVTASDEILVELINMKR